MKKKIEEKDMTVKELVGIMLGAFETNQKYMDKKFDSIDKKFDSIDKKFNLVGENFKEVKQKIDNISLNIVDVVRKEEFEKLETRVVDLEEVTQLSTKKN